MIKKVSVELIKEIAMNDGYNISKEAKAEMAIPSYLHRNPLIPWLMRKRYEEIKKLCNKNKNNQILEFGCGVGIFLPELCEMAGKVYAIDIFPQYAKLLSEKLKLNVNFLDNISEVDDLTLDVIVAADVMEHLNSPDDYVKQFRSKLKTNGRLIVSGPTENYFYKLGRKVAEILSGNGDFKEEYHHTNIYNLQKVIQNNGFELVNRKSLPFNYLPRIFEILEFSKTS